MQKENVRSYSASLPEDAFIEIFAQAFGLDQVQSLAHEYPVSDIYGNARSVDYAIDCDGTKVAFEIDGLQWHLPGHITVEKFEDDLLRQNSLIHQGWRVFRWSDRQIMAKPETVKQELQLFLEKVFEVSSIHDFLPKQKAALFELRNHQQEALDALETMRAEGKTIALITHAQGAGKTILAVADAKRMAGRTLFIAHRRELVLQARKAFKTIWPEAETGILLGNSKETGAFNLVASIQSINEKLHQFNKDQFDYLIVDEAHHATAESYKKLIRYFQPKFLLGLTATPDRADGESIMEIFKDVAHRMDLKTAIEKKELVPIRCVRVNTNVDITKVRFNELQYNWRDIEDSLVIPGRDELIIKTYLDHVPGKKAVVFCVNIRHGESLADLFSQRGVRARSVSGRLSKTERDEILADFQYGDISVLCACDILNEGWDCPEVEALFMARPTLSKVIYLQQLGRGTRKAEGKDSLVVFDFIDNSSRYNQSLNLHRVIGNNKYRPGSLVLAPAELIEDEENSINLGQKPTSVLDIALWVKDFQEIDIFNWQEIRKDMISVADLEIQLNTSDGFIRRAIERSEISPDHEFEIGARRYYYFAEARISDICNSLKIEPVVKENIKKRFMGYVAKMDMAASYKPVFLLSFLKVTDELGQAPTEMIAQAFCHFYEERHITGKPVESEKSELSSFQNTDLSQVKRLMLANPFEKFERRKYFEYMKTDLSKIRMNPHLWKSLTEQERAEIKNQCQKSIDNYYQKLEVKHKT